MPVAKAKPILPGDDLSLAKSAQQKRQMGQVPTTDEMKALKRVMRDREEKLRWEYYATVPAIHYRRLAGGVRADQLTTWAAKYGIKFDGKLVDLLDVLPKLHKALMKKGEAIGQPVAGSDQDAFVKLVSSGADPVQISRGLVQLLARKISAGISTGTLDADDLEHVKKLMAELRQQESDSLDLQERRRELVPIALVERVCGALASKLVIAAGTIENSIATEFSVWLADPKLKDMDSDARAKLVRDFAAKVCRDVRTAEAEDVKKLIADVEKAEE